MNKPVAWIAKTYYPNGLFEDDLVWSKIDENSIPLYTHPVNPKYDPETGEPLIDGYPLFSGLPHPVKELTDEEIDSVVYELRQKSFDPERWLDVYTVAIETIIQLRDELAILRKAQNNES